MSDKISAADSLLKRATGPLAKNINPHIPLAASIAFSIVSCYAYTYSHTLAAAASTTLASYTTALAKDISTKHRKDISHTYGTACRVSDAFIFTGIALNPAIPLNLGFIALISQVLISHLAALRQSISKKKIEPTVSRSDIHAILITSTIAEKFYSGALYWSLIIITGLSLSSFIALQARTIRNTPSKKPHKTL